MTHEEYKQQLTAWAGLTEKRLAALCDEYLPQQSELGQAARYSLLGGGKRVRAVLTLAWMEAFSQFDMRRLPAGRCRRCRCAGLCLCAGNAALLLAHSR